MHPSAQVLDVWKDAACEMSLQVHSCAPLLSAGTQCLSIQPCCLQACMPLLMCITQRQKCLMPNLTQLAAASVFRRAALQRRFTPATRPAEPAHTGLRSQGPSHGTAGGTRQGQDPRGEQECAWGKVAGLNPVLLDIVCLLSVVV